MFAKLKAKVKGWRTVIGASAIGLVGAAQLIGTVDISPLLRVFLKDDQIVGAVMVVIALFVGYLRYVTTTPIGQSPAPSQTAPDFNRGVDEGN